LSARGYRVAVLAGDGIGPEVVAEACKAAEAAGARFGFGLDWVDYDLGADRWHRTGEALPDAVLEELREVDAILLGAVGRPDVPPGVLERGLLLRLRFELDLYVNFRPVKLYPGVASPLADVKPDDIDLLVVRENTEGVYVGAGGTVHRGSPAEAATETSIETRAGVERVLRFAAAKARERAGRLTLVHKTNVLVHAGDLWQRAARAVADWGRVTSRVRPMRARRATSQRRPGRRRRVPQAARAQTAARVAPSRGRRWRSRQAARVVAAGWPARKSSGLRRWTSRWRSIDPRVTAAVVRTAQRA
jgi:isocitrate/isopropylmalate dehydrogenase